ncbi:unnamed protein product [Coccothraustes coccothraustes]
MRRGAPGSSLLARPGWGGALPPTLPGRERNRGDPAAASWSLAVDGQSVAIVLLCSGGMNLEFQLYVRVC